MVWDAFQVIGQFPRCVTKLHQSLCHHSPPNGYLPVHPPPAGYLCTCSPMRRFRPIQATLEDIGVVVRIFVPLLFLIDLFSEEGLSCDCSCLGLMQVVPTLDNDADETRVWGFGPRNSMDLMELGGGHTSSPPVVTRHTFVILLHHLLLPVYSCLLV